MKSRYKLLFIILFIITCNNKSYSGVFDPFDFGARALGMGSAFTAASDDGSAIYYNPAGTIQFKKPEVYFMYRDFYGLGLIQNNYFSYVQPGIGPGNAGLAWKLFSVTNSVSYLTWDENIYYVNYSFNIRKKISAGINLKYMNLQSSELIGASFGIDAGLLYKPKDYLRLGMTFINLNNPKTSYQYSRLKEDVKSSVRTGVLVKFSKHLRMTYDLEKSENEKIIHHTGMELSIFENSIVLRGGFTTSENRFAGTDPSFGFSVNLKRIKLDYALHKHYDIGTEDIFALSLIF